MQANNSNSNTAAQQRKQQRAQQRAQANKRASVLLLEDSTYSKEETMQQTAHALRLLNCASTVRVLNAEGDAFAVVCARGTTQAEARALLRNLLREIHSN